MHHQRINIVGALEGYGYIIPSLIHMHRATIDFVLHGGFQPFYRVACTAVDKAL